MRFYAILFKLVIHILSLSNSHNNVASIKKNRGDKSYLVVVVLNTIKEIVLGVRGCFKIKKL